MNCPICGGKTRVAYSVPDCESVQRQRQCEDCKHMFYTSEYEADGEQMQLLLKEKGRREYLRKLKKWRNEK